MTRHLVGTPKLSFADGCKLLTLWKQSEDYGFPALVHSQTLQQCLKALDRAYVNLFVGRAQPPTYRILAVGLTESLNACGPDRSSGIPFL